VLRNTYVASRETVMHVRCRISIRTKSLRNLWFMDGMPEER
jgi:hypothetical protein